MCLDNGITPCYIAYMNSVTRFSNKNMRRVFSFASIGMNMNSRGWYWASYLINKFKICTMNKFKEKYQIGSRKNAHHIHMCMDKQHMMCCILKYVFRYFAKKLKCGLSISFFIAFRGWFFFFDFISDQYRT